MTTTALTTQPGSFSLAALDKQLEFCKLLSSSQLVPVPLQGKPQDVLIILLTGQELGLQPMQSLRTVYVVDGKPTLSAQIMAGLIQKTRICEQFRLKSASEKEATWLAQRRGEDEPTVFSYTIQDAQRARLTGKRNWQQHPKAMLINRVITLAARTHFADIIAGIYDPEELESDDGKGNGSAAPRVTVVASAPAPQDSPVTVDAPRPEAETTGGDEPEGAVDSPPPQTNPYLPADKVIDVVPEEVVTGETAPALEPDDNQLSSEIRGLDYSAEDKVIEALAWAENQIDNITDLESRYDIIESIGNHPVVAQATQDHKDRLSARYKRRVQELWKAQQENKPAPAPEKRDFPDPPGGAPQGTPPGESAPAGEYTGQAPSNDSETPTMTFGMILKTARKQSKVTQKQLADKVGMKQAYLSRVENGKAAPPEDMKVLMEISALLNTPSDKLIKAARSWEAGE